MNHCLNCGNELTGKEKFCSNCGTIVKDSEPTGTSATYADEDTHHSAVTGDELEEKFSSTPSSAKTSVQQSQYFNYFTETLKTPTSAIGIQSSVFGWINILLLAVTTTWTNFNILKGSIQVGMNEFGISSFFGLENSLFSALRNELLPRFFIINLLVALIFVVSAFLILKFTTKFNKPFNQLVTEFGGFLTPNIAITLVAALLTTLIASPTTLLLAGSALFFSFLLCFAAYNFYLHGRVRISGLDNVYVLLLSNLVVLVILLIFVYIQLEPMFAFLEQMDSLINQFNW